MSATVRIEYCEVIRDSGKALLIRIGGEVEKWIPQSQIDDDSEVWKEGDKGDLVIKAWFAEKEGLEEWAS
jgi:hypothetical protein